jgi:phenolic acid decarboxylase
VLHSDGRLFQQYVVDKFAQIDLDRLLFLKNNQKVIRADLYAGLEDHIRQNDGSRVGRPKILPSSYIGG